MDSSKEPISIIESESLEAIGPNERRSETLFLGSDACPFVSKPVQCFLSEQMKLPVCSYLPSDDGKIGGAILLYFRAFVLQDEVLGKNVHLSCNSYHECGGILVTYSLNRSLHFMKRF